MTFYIQAMMEVGRAEERANFLYEWLEAKADKDKSLEGATRLALDLLDDLENASDYLKRHQKRHEQLARSASDLAEEQMTIFFDLAEETHRGLYADLAEDGRGTAIDFVGRAWKDLYSTTEGQAGFADVWGYIRNLIYLDLRTHRETGKGLLYDKTKADYERITGKPYKRYKEASHE